MNLNTQQQKTLRILRNGGQFSDETYLHNVYNSCRKRFADGWLEAWYDGNDKYSLTDELSVGLAIEQVARAAKKAYVKNDDSMIALEKANDLLEAALRTELEAYFDRRQGDV